MQKDLRDEDGFRVFEKGVTECMKVHGLRKPKERQKSMR